MEITRFKSSDIQEMVTLFYETVHSINAQDYLQTQLDVWAPKDDQAHKEQSWLESFLNNITFVARLNGLLVGFIDMTQHGYLDRIYVHKDFQRQGIASLLVHVIETEAKKLALTELTVDASITAMSFFMNRGYQFVRKQNIERKGVTLVNFKMIKLFR
ncbi:GNAT family N-acetyltransferase [Paenibacillus arenosi]|uniref:GNAT family N-acetyltransferase n=1 Tax=Paenibacillus arenosi TaxID=2774142 RepID=A0ABR9B2C3_9BACL|nr:GNAT family N-acetyltransferase [Paenibacillus arenosi]